MPLGGILLCHDSFFVVATLWIRLGLINPMYAQTPIKVCSFWLKGSGFKENVDSVPGTVNSLVGSTAAISWLPRRAKIIWINTVGISKIFSTNNSWVLKHAIIMIVAVPRIAIRIVPLGRLGLSVFDTIDMTFGFGIQLPLEVDLPARIGISTWKCS